jgi:hypothetical protein
MSLTAAGLNPARESEFYSCEEAMEVFTHVKKLWKVDKVLLCCLHFSYNIMQYVMTGISLCQK